MHERTQAKIPHYSQTDRTPQRTFQAVQGQAAQQRAKSREFVPFAADAWPTSANSEITINMEPSAAC